MFSLGNIVFDSISVAKDAYQTFGIKVVPFDPEVSAKLTEEERHYLQWRECEKFHQNTLTGLFLRYAVDKDKKERHAAEKSEYYKKHGRIVEDDMKQPVVDLRSVCVCVCVCVYVCVCVCCLYVCILW